MTGHLRAPPAAHLTLSQGKPRVMIPNILSIAGSDPSGGAGLQADIKAISANGGYAMAVPTALTVQNTLGVQQVHPLPARLFTDQLDALFADIAVQAVKIGLLGSAEVARAVTRALEGGNAPVILDPVLTATRGARLLDPRAMEALRALLPLCTVITPNLPEAAELLNQPEASTRARMQAQAEALLALGPKAVLLKGGHLPGTESPDLLVTRTHATWFEAPREQARNSHGTGCTLSSALATQLALTGDLVAATRAAKSFTLNAIRGGNALQVGAGNGPTDHFFASRHCPPPPAHTG